MQNAGPPSAGDSPSPPTFSHILNELLDKKGWDVAELSRRCPDIPYSTLLSWTKKSRDGHLSLSRLPSLARALGTTVGALFGETPKVGAHQVLVTVGEYVIDPTAYEILHDGGTLPPRRAWYAKIAPGSYAADESRYRELLAALPKKKR